MEIKAKTQGGMKSLWAFMRGRSLIFAIRCSLDNFGCFEYLDKYENAKGEVLTETRSVGVCPLFAMSQLTKTGESLMRYSKNFSVVSRTNI